MDLFSCKGSQVVECHVEAPEVEEHGGREKEEGLFAKGRPFDYRACGARREVRAVCNYRWDVDDEQDECQDAHCPAVSDGGMCEEGVRCGWV